MGVYKMSYVYLTVQQSIYSYVVSSYTSRAFVRRGADFIRAKDKSYYISTGVFNSICSQVSED